MYKNEMAQSAFVSLVGGHNNILKLGSPSQRWRAKEFALWRGTRQHFEIVNSKLLISAGTWEKNEAGCAGKSPYSTTN